MLAKVVPSLNMEANLHVYPFVRLFYVIISFPPGHSISYTIARALSKDYDQLKY